MSEPNFMSSRLRRGDISAAEKLSQISWSMVLWLCCIFAFGFAALYSAGGGKLMPWAEPQLIRFVIGVGLLAAVAVIDIRLIMRFAYPLWAIVVLLLIFVEVKGVIGGGAQRWIDFGVVNLQPSELMKPALVLALARYFHGRALDQIASPFALLVPLMLILVPVALILLQPDLGTGMVIVMGSTAVLFMAGVRLWKFVLVAVIGLAASPVAWSLMHEYQRNRVRTLFNPEADPLGTGYHIIQSKIALGSGGLFGKGLMGGTQSQLNFLPEHQTDFILALLAEELGMIGAIVLIGLYCLVLIYGYAIAFSCRHQFGRLVAMGITTTFFLYFFINIAMVTGLIPVVGVPLPLISYGGTALLNLMFCMGLLMNVWVHRDVQMAMRGGFGDF